MSTTVRSRVEKLQENAELGNIDPNSEIAVWTKALRRDLNSGI